eukprot:ANDGO_03734.mRNA.1 Polyphosphatidylinositol phosphatase INP53
MASIRERIEGLLNSTETCTLAAELTLVAGEFRDPCAIALISSRKEEAEHALLLVGFPRSGDSEEIYPVNIFPLSSDLLVKVNGENMIEIAFRTTSQVLCMEAPASPAMWDIITALTKASQGSANRLNQDVPNWIDGYRGKFGLTKVEKGIQAIDSANQNIGLSFGDDPVADPTMLKSSQIRADWIANQMRFREALFTSTSPATVFVGTWNVNEKKVEDLSAWLQPELGSDIIAIGFQEIDMTAGALVTQETANGKFWEDSVTATLSRSSTKYVRLVAKQLVGILIVVYVKEEHMMYVKNVQTKYQAVGIMGIMGNKGGVAVRFDFYETSVCCITAHLAAHMGHVARRNQNFHDILANLAFTSKCKSVYDHDMIFFFGDLNYRVPLEDADVKSRIVRNDLDYLLKHDQLNVEKAAGRVLAQFTEGKISFPPTYKYDPGTDNYDSSEKKRVPAWTDRILFKGSGIQQKSYGRCDALKSSDHRPVYSMFNIEFRKIIPAKYEEVYREVIKFLDKMENEMLPECSLSSDGFDFGDVYYNVPRTETLWIQNSGNVLVEFAFVPSIDENRICKPWVNISPRDGMILPSERAEVKITVTVNKDSAPLLNLGSNLLEDILILHLKNGRDHFVPISGRFMRSCFGNSLENLVSILGPVRSSLPIQLAPPSEQNQRKLKLPKELWRLTDYIFRHGMDAEALFEDPGDPDEIRFLRERLDCNESFNGFQGSVHSVAVCLVRFLESLSPAVIPLEVAKRTLDASSSLTASRQLVAKSLPPVHFNVFHYVTAFLRELLTHSAKNGLTVDRLSCIFAAVLMKGGNALSKNNDFKKRAAFILHFLRDAPPPPSESSTDGGLLLST